MHDIIDTPLSDREVAFLLTIGVQFWTNYKTGEIHISKRWWNGVNEGKRSTVEIILNHWRSTAYAKSAS